MPTFYPKTGGAYTAPVEADITAPGGLNESAMPESASEPAPAPEPEYADEE